MIGGSDFDVIIVARGEPEKRWLRERGMPQGL